MSETLTETLELRAVGERLAREVGVLAVMRTLHPRGEPRPTVGLAAQFLVQKPGRHLKLRELLEHGAVTRVGALRIAGDAPFFERSMLPAEALWSALHGLNAWPASVARVGGAVVTCGLAEWLTSAEASRAVEAIERRMKCTVLVTADSEEVAFQRARAIVNAAGLDSVGIPVRGEIGPEAEQLIQVHTLLRGVVPVLRLSSAEGQPAPDAPLLADYPRVVVLCGRVGAAATG